MPEPVSAVDAATIRTVSRGIWNLVEPLASSVYFVPEVQEAYAGIGFDDYPTSYFTSRGACMGRVPGEVVAAAFAVFDPALVIASVDKGWSLTTPDAVLAARLDGQTKALARIFSDAGIDAAGPAVTRATEIMWHAAEAAAASPAGGFAGRPMFAGLYSLGLPGDGGLGDLWRAADTLREHRGDSHTIAWGAMGMSAVEVTLLTELWWGGNVGRYIRTRGWNDEAIAAGIRSLQGRGFVTGDEPPAYTPQGEQVRAVIEEMTDNGEAVVAAALGDDADELFGLLEPMAAAIIAAKGYPRDPATLPRSS